MDWKTLIVGIVLLASFFAIGFYFQSDALARSNLLFWWSQNQAYVYLFMIALVILFVITGLRKSGVIVKPMPIERALELVENSPLRGEKVRFAWLANYFVHGSDFGRKILAESGMYKIKFNPSGVLPNSCPFKGPVFLYLFAYPQMIPSGGSPLAGITDLEEDFAYYRSKKVTNGILEFTGLIESGEAFKYALEDEDRPIVINQTPHSGAIA